MKKGFTIVELLAVIAIIGVLLILVIPTVNRFILNTEEKGYKIQINAIKDAGINFTLENIDALMSDSKYHSFVIDLKMLKDLAFVDYEIKNPKTNNYFSDDTLITLTLRNGNYYAEVLDFDSSSILENVKYKNHFILIKKDSNEVKKEDVLVFNINGGVYSGEYTAEPEQCQDTIIEGYNTICYKITVETDEYIIKKFNKI